MGKTRYKIHGHLSIQPTNHINHYLSKTWGIENYLTTTNLTTNNVVQLEVTKFMETLTHDIKRSRQKILKTKLDKFFLWDSW